MLAHAAGREKWGSASYKVSQMDMAIRVEENIVRLDVAMDNALLVNVADGAAELGYPEAHRLFGEGLSRDVETQVATVHQVDDDVSAGLAGG